MQLTQRQNKILDIIKKEEPITGENIAKILNVSKSTLRTDFSILKKMDLINSKQKIGYYYNQNFSEKEKKKSIDKLHKILVDKEQTQKLAKDIMSIPVTIDENVSVYKTILLMFEKDIGTVFITKDGKLAGIVSRKDLLRSAIGKMDIENIPINLIMTRMPNIIFATEDETIESCVKKVIDHQIDSIPIVKVVKKNAKETYDIVGRLTKTNIAKLFLDMIED